MGERILGDRAIGKGFLPSVEETKTTRSLPAADQARYLSYQLSGPHGRVRGRLLRLNAVLQHEPELLSRVSLVALGAAVSDCLRECSAAGMHLIQSEGIRERSGRVRGNVPKGTKLTDSERQAARVQRRIAERRFHEKMVKKHQEETEA